MTAPLILRREPAAPPSAGDTGEIVDVTADLRPAGRYSITVDIEPAGDGSRMLFTQHGIDPDETRHLRDDVVDALGRVRAAAA